MKQEIQYEKILLVDDDSNYIWLLKIFCSEKAMK